MTTLTPAASESRVPVSHEQLSSGATPAARLAISQLGKAFSLYLLGRVLAAVAQAGFLAVLARSVTVSEFADVSAFFSAAALTAVVVDLGNSPALSRATARGHAVEAAELTMATNLQAVVAAALWVAVCLVLSTFGVLGGWQALLGPWILAERILAARSAVLLAEKRNVLVLVLLVVRRSTPILFFLVAATFLGSAPAACLAMSIAGLLALVVAAVLAPWSLRPRRLSGLTQSNLSFYANSLLAQGQQLDVVVANLLVPGAGSGLYAGASRLISPLRLIPSALGGVVLAHASGSKDVAALQKRVPIVGIVMAAVYAGFALCAGPVVSKMYGDRYSGAAPSLRILLVGLCFASMSSSYTSLLQAGDREQTVVLCGVVASVLGFATAGALAVPYGAEGVATGMSVLFIVQWLLLARAAKGLT